MHSVAFRRCFCLSSSTSSVPFRSPGKKKIVFLGSPWVSVTVLDALLDASSEPQSLFEVAAVVTQPPSARDRGRKVMPSPIAIHALNRGIHPGVIFTPERASDEKFLYKLNEMQPELCITAAYGNILPSKFLAIPLLGTVNLHPSLLPLYRGSAPVQRALKDGVKETGVSLAFTVRDVDAGPIIANEKVEVDGHIKAPDLVTLLFDRGSKLLLKELPSILDGYAWTKAQPQNDSKASLAPKISPDESWLSFKEEALVLHNKVRAFAGWPGTWARLKIVDSNGEHNILELKIITTRVCGYKNEEGCEVDDVMFNKGRMVFPCGSGTALEVLEVQLPGKKLVSAAAFWNGMRGRRVKRLL